MPPHSEASLSTKLNHLASQRKNQPTLSKSEATKGTTSYKPSSNGAEPLKPPQPSAPFCFSAGSPFLNTPKLTTPPHLSTLSHLAMGNMDQQEGNGAERHNDQQYHMGSVDDLQVEKKALMNSWSFIFPLTEVSKRDDCLPLTHPAWHNTPNLWWRFMPNRPPLLPPPEQRTSRTSRSRSHLKESLAIHPLQNIVGPHRKGTDTSGNYSKEVLDMGNNRRPYSRHSSPTQAHPNSYGNRDLHPRDSHVSNPNESLRACHCSGMRSNDTHDGPKAG